MGIEPPTEEKMVNYRLHLIPDRHSVHAMEVVCRDSISQEYEDFDRLNYGTPSTYRHFIDKSSIKNSTLNINVAMGKHRYNIITKYRSNTAIEKPIVDNLANPDRSIIERSQRALKDMLDSKASNLK
uniref:hypothetical protein n=1 Tax=Pseudofabraea citricarpa TaxID=1664388 RepID=UPI0022FD4C44|nr:hypothetical protein PN052_mgp26 [Pseudofabraea citricarpa]WAX38801.1 hypothetical protein [Pseudofabraea citricarpa]